MMLTIGFSPCPNDTFIFHALVHGLAGDPCPGFAEPRLADVETLNSWAMEARLDVTKISFHALGHVREDYVLLHAGSALGRGCGPLLVSGGPRSREELATGTIAIPGRFTTAAMLLKLFLPEAANLVSMPFHTIMPAIAQGRVDAGVIIHESRFTYARQGLLCLQDLGAWWEEETGHPIPLGGIVARRKLGGELLGRVDGCIRKSVQYAFANRSVSLPYIRAHAQELEEGVMTSHIDLYVNSFSEELGGEGLAAIREFMQRGEAAGVIPRSTAAICRP